MNWENQIKFKEGFKIDDLFIEGAGGIASHRDSFVIDSDKSSLQNRIIDFFELPANEVKSKYLLEDTDEWQVVSAKQANMDINNFAKISYRPLDIRHIYYDDNLITRSRRDLMRNFLDENFGLVSCKRQDNSTIAYVTKNLIDQRYFSAPGSIGKDYVFPLYIYPKLNGLLDETTRTPNLNMAIVDTIAASLGLTFTPEKTNHSLTPALSQRERGLEPVSGIGGLERPSGTGAAEQSPSPFGRGVGVREDTFAPIDLLDYIYAVLHSPTYRETYKEFLKIDFPRVPYPTDKEKFWQLVALGEALRQAHLLEFSPSAKGEGSQISYPEAGDNVVDKPRFEAGRVYINATQYFDGVPELAWNFYIGGYQPAQKWLKDRKGRTQNYEDILHYQNIIRALMETHRLMQAVDEVMND